MSKIQIDLPEDITKKLKILALQADRSLSKFVPLYLTEAVSKNLITVDERTRNIVSTTSTNSASATTLEQLKSMGVSTLKIDRTQDILSQKQQLQEEKLDRQKQLQTQKQEQKQREEKLKHIKERMKAVLGYLYPYLEMESNQAAINYLLSMSNEEYEKWLQERKYEDDNYKEPKQYLYQTEIETREKNLKIKDNDIYQKIKKYCIDNSLTEALYRVMEYPDPLADNVDYFNEQYDNFIYKALGSPTDGSYTYSQEEWQEIADNLTWIDRGLNKPQFF